MLGAIWRLWYQVKPHTVVEVEYYTDTGTVSVLVNGLPVHGPTKEAILEANVWIDPDTGELVSKPGAPAARYGHKLIIRNLRMIGG